MFGVSATILNPITMPLFDCFSKTQSSETIRSSVRSDPSNSHIVGIFQMDVTRAGFSMACGMDTSLWSGLMPIPSCPQVGCRDEDPDGEGPGCGALLASIGMESRLWPAP